MLGRAIAERRNKSDKILWRGEARAVYPMMVEEESVRVTLRGSSVLKNVLRAGVAETSSGMWWYGARHDRA